MTETKQCVGSGRSSLTMMTEQVRRDRVGKYLVSTVYLPDMYYETMVFLVKKHLLHQTTWTEMEARRYNTRPEALIGHEKLKDKMERQVELDKRREQDQGLEIDRPAES